MIKIHKRKPDKELLCDKRVISCALTNNICILFEKVLNKQISKVYIINN